MKYLILTITTSLLLFQLVACQRKEASEFLGKWNKISGPGASQIEIVTNGDHYLFIEDGGNKTGMTYKDGMLMIAGMFPVTYIKESGHITTAGRGGVGEYIRANYSLDEGAQQRPASTEQKHGRIDPHTASIEGSYVWQNGNEKIELGISKDPYGNLNYYVRSSVTPANPALGAYTRSGDLISTLTGERFVIQADGSLLQIYSGGLLGFSTPKGAVNRTFRKQDIDYLPRNN